MAVIKSAPAENKQGLSQNATGKKSERDSPFYMGNVGNDREAALKVKAPP